MEENTNLNMETTADEIIFDDTEPTSEVTEENNSDDLQEQEIEEETTQEVTPEEQTIKVKYNGADVEMTPEQAIPYIQKGMNYDKIAGRLNMLENSYEWTTFNELARNSEMSLRDYVDYLSNFQNRTLELKFLQDLKTQYPEGDENLLNELAKKQVSEMITKNQQNKIDSEERARQEEDQWWSEQIDAFMNEYPDVDYEHLPEEVINALANGEPLISAYRGFENKQLRERLKALETNASNKKKAVGRLTEDASSDSSQDPFLLGFLGK